MPDLSIPCPQKGGSSVYTYVCNDKDKCTYKKCKNYGAAPMSMEGKPEETRYCISCKHHYCESWQYPCNVCLDTDPPGRARPMWAPKEKEAFLTVVGSDTQTVEASSYVEDGKHVLDLKISGPDKEKPDPTEFPIQLNLF